MHWGSRCDGAPARPGGGAGCAAARVCGVPSTRGRCATVVSGQGSATSSPTDVAMPLLDLAEIDAVTGLHPLWSSRRPAPVWFRRADFLGDPTVPLDEAVRDLVEERSGRRPTGRVGLLANLRTWGWLFNPISLYFCAGGDGAAVETLVAEVENTPWHERCSYVVGAPGRHRFAKTMHVSPFLPMDVDYVLRYSAARRAPRRPFRRDAWRRAPAGRHPVPAPPDARPSERSGGCCGPTRRSPPGLGGHLRSGGSPAPAGGALPRTPGSAGRASDAVTDGAASLSGRKGVIDVHRRSQTTGEQRCRGQRRVRQRPFAPERAPPDLDQAADRPPGACCLRPGRAAQGAPIEITEAGRTRQLGAGEPVARVTVHDPRAYGALLRSGSVGPRCRPTSPGGGMPTT